jgi:3-oxoacyl-[acyl-carrier protein] reductase
MTRCQLSIHSLLMACYLKRLGKPQDIANIVVFIVSGQARWLKGQTIQASGGVVM